MTLEQGLFGESNMSLNDNTDEMMNQVTWTTIGLVFLVEVSISANHEVLLHTSEVILCKFTVLDKTFVVLRDDFFRTVRGLEIPRRVSSKNYRNVFEVCNGDR